MFLITDLSMGFVLLGPARRSMRLQEQRKSKESDECTSPLAISTEHQAAINLAQRIMDTYFKGSYRKETEGTKALRFMGRQLSEPVKDLKPILKQILKTLSGDTISVFEFMESKIATSLKDFLVVDSKAGKSGANIDSALSRIKDLVVVGLVDEGNGVETGLRGLIRKLKHAIEASEKFPVRHVIGRSIRHPGPGSRAGNGSS